MSSKNIVPNNALNTHSSAFSPDERGKVIASCSTSVWEGEECEIFLLRDGRWMATFQNFFATPDLHEDEEFITTVVVADTAERLLKFGVGDCMREDLRKQIEVWKQQNMTKP